MKKNEDINSALNILKQSAIGHADATESGDYKTANLCCNEIEKVIGFLKKHDQLMELQKLLQHSNVGVRLWAARYLLPIAQKKAKSILKTIAKGEGIHAFNAEMTLEEWRKGNLK